MGGVADFRQPDVPVRDLTGDTLRNPVAFGGANTIVNAITCERKLAAVTPLFILIDNAADRRWKGWVLHAIEDDLTDGRLPAYRFAARFEVDSSRQARLLSHFVDMGREFVCRSPSPLAISLIYGAKAIDNLGTVACQRSRFALQARENLTPAHLNARAVLFNVCPTLKLRIPDKFEKQVKLIGNVSCCLVAGLRDLFLVGVQTRIKPAIARLYEAHRGIASIVEQVFGYPIADLGNSSLRLSGLRE